MRDKDQMQPGELISQFMQQICEADRVIVVLSDKYLDSIYCMQELHGIYLRSAMDADQFRSRIVPLSVSGLRISQPENRVGVAKQWKARYAGLKESVEDLGMKDLGLFYAMKRWYNDIGDILHHVSDVLQPRGFEQVAKNNYAALKQMLERTGRG